MSYDLAVWAGDRPQDDGQASEEYDRLTAYFDDDDADREPASERIRAFIEELLGRYPALGEPGDEDSPWAMGPDPGNANGDFVYLTMTFSGARRCLEWIVETALRHKLICFDPQSETLR